MVARRVSRKKTARPKRRAKGKGKGQQFEREVCKRLSEWVTDGERSDVFWRSAMSGGRATVHGAGKVRQAGDITAVSHEGYELTDRCYFECKFYKNLNLQLFLLHGGGPLAGFWKETCKRAYEHNRHPVLIVKENNETPLIIVDRLVNGLTGMYTDRDLGSVDACMEIDCKLFKLDDVLGRRYQRPQANGEGHVKRRRHS